MTWLLTATGRVFDLQFIGHDSIELDDIAAALSRLNRFTGHTARPYSVAEHSLMVTEILERDGGVRNPAVLLAGLMHDAHEAYTGDVSSPMKQQLDALTAGAWSREEARVQRHVLHRFGLWPTFEDFHYTVKHADLVALATERRDLMPPGGPAWPVLNGIEPCSWLNLATRAHMSDTDWRQAFLDRFAELSYQTTTEA